MRWLPPWLARAYAKLYVEKRVGSFGFSQAARILEVSDERRLAKTLAMLRTSGYLQVTRDPTDSRRKLFNLLDPVSTTVAFAIQSRAKTSELGDKFKAASNFLRYYIGGAYACYQYHRYSAPGSIDISVLPDELHTWVALLSDKDIAISVNEIPAEKPSATNVHFETDFDIRFSKEIITIGGIKYLSPELLVARGLSENYPGLDDVIAILIVQRKKLDWDKLADLCEEHYTSRILAAILEMLNFESSRTLFNPNTIKKIGARANRKVRLDFPPDKKSEPPEEDYLTISSKWNVVPHFTKSFLSKLVTDLVRSK
ncbi:MAG: hypothetical protein M1368_08715 [Thaumarchaeota archaeon]|nr:hypothetical protein [Nitrososphaerota archaeon]